MQQYFSIPAVLWALLLFAAQSTATAQAPAHSADRTVLKVKGLDHSTRDALTTELETKGLRLTYACVPAGILVLEPARQGSATPVLSSALSAVEKHARSKDISVLPISLQEAEMQCAQARNR